MSLFDENAEILNGMTKDGSDLKPPRPVDFSHVFAHHASAAAFATVIGEDGFSVEIEKVAGWDDPWDVKVSKIMVPSVENITSTEERLARVAQAHGGRADGWGFMRV